MNTPYLGQYFVTQKKVHTHAAFSKSLVYKKDLFNFQRTLDESTDSHGFAYYKYGSFIKTFYLNDEGVQGNHPRHLEMPANVFYPNGGMCIDSTPVRFLVNREAHCVRAISRNHCEKATNSPLSAQSHILVDSVMPNKSHISGFLYVAMDSVRQNSVQTELKFLCFSNGSDYVTFSNNIFRTNVSDRFLNPEVLEDDVSSCEFSGSVEDILTTSYDEKEHICRNVLISVSYDFVWKGTDILNLTVTYVLADVPVAPFAFIAMRGNISGISDNTVNSFVMPKNETVNRMELYVSQHFIAKFRHYRSVKMFDVNMSTGEDVATYSGNPGYEIGHPVVAVRKNDTSFGWEAVPLEVWGSGKYTILLMIPV
jgi:hypothetical protein